MKTGDEYPLGQWIEQGPTTLDAEYVGVGVLREYLESEREPDMPQGVVIQCGVEFMGVPLYLACKMDVAQAVQFRNRLDSCIEAVKAGTMPQVQE